ncbi:MAG: Hsp20/alpha crystallin family protein [Clostridia bacterium]|nr:Hsp20/alpha crystallin family protein [Clostridia bacterium]
MLYLSPYTRKNHPSAYDPFAELERLERAFFSDSTMNGFLTDISDKGDYYLLEAELAGFNKEDIKVDVEGECLTISATRKQENEDKKAGYIRRERCYGSFKRSFDISDVDTERIEAAYENGVLKLNLPKRRPQQSSARTLEIK